MAFVVAPCVMEINYPYFDAVFDGSEWTVKVEVARRTPDAEKCGYQLQRREIRVLNNAPTTKFRAGSNDDG